MQDYNQSLRKDKRRKKVKIFLIVLSIIIILSLSTLIYTIFYTNVFRFNKIILSGSSEITLETLFPEEQKPYLFDNVTIDNLKIAKFTVNKNYFKKILNITIKERKPFGVWCGGETVSEKVIGEPQAPDAANVSSSSSTASTSNEMILSTIVNSNSKCYWFDNTGLIYDRAPATTGTLVKSLNELGGRNLELGDNILPKEILDKMFKIFDILDRAEINVINYELPDLKLEEFSAILPNKTVIYFSLRNDIATIFEALQSIKPKLYELKYVDLRSSNKIFYK